MIQLYWLFETSARKLLDKPYNFWRSLYEMRTDEQISSPSKRARVRPIIAPALATGMIRQKNHIIMRNVSDILRSGATGVGCSLGALSGCRKTGYITPFCVSACYFAAQPNPNSRCSLGHQNRI